MPTWGVWPCLLDRNPAVFAPNWIPRLRTPCSSAWAVSWLGQLLACLPARRCMLEAANGDSMSAAWPGRSSAHWLAILYVLMGAGRLIEEET